jgi:hypothetical protein
VATLTRRGVDMMDGLGQEVEGEVPFMMRAMTHSYER